MRPGEPDSRPPSDVLGSIQLPLTAPGAPESGPGDLRRLLQDWHPVVGSLEWILAGRYWETSGLDAFVRSEVPYVVNNTSWLAESAASVLLAACEDLDENAPIRILELGAGLGLFARQLLNALKTTCTETQRSEYKRLTFYITDGSRRTVERWRETGLFSEHEEHIVLATCDAADPTRLQGIPPAEEPIELEVGGLQAVFANYVLDSLPATILRRTVAVDESPASSPNQTAAGIEELRVRAYISEAHREEIQRRFGLDLDDLPALVRASTAASPRLNDEARVRDAGFDRADASDSAPGDGRAAVASSTPGESDDPRDLLLRILPYAEFEVGYGPPTTPATVPVPPEILGTDADRIVWNYGALASLDRILGLLRDSGFLLTRDLGPADPARTGDLSYVARFGPSLAFTVSFPVLDAFVARRGGSSIAAEGDPDRPIHTRLIRSSRRSDGSDIPNAAGASSPAGVFAAPGRSSASGTSGATGESRLEATFRAVFADDRQARADVLAEEATRHINAGRHADALHSYREALELCPDDWHLLGNAAQFLTQQLVRPAEGAELVRRALQAHPSSSPFLWNTMGNCHFYLGEHQTAHECYLRARSIHPSDPQTELNLAYTLTAFGHFEDALLAIARGLAHDRDERFEAAFLAKQKEVVAAVQKRRQEEDARANRRHEAFSSAR